MSIHVRIASASDHAQLLPLVEAFYRELDVPEAFCRLPSTLAGVLSRDDTVVFVAEADGETVGTAAVSLSYGLEVGLYGELEDLYVLPDWRDRGAGAALLEAAAEWAQTRGCHDMEVVLTPAAQQDEHLVAWYAARGFLSTGRTILERRLAT